MFYGPVSTFTTFYGILGGADQTESQSKQTNLRKERMVRLEVLSNQSMKGMKVPPSAWPPADAALMPSLFFLTAFLGNVWTESQSKQTNLRKERMVRLEVLSNQSMKGMKVPPSAWPPADAALMPSLFFLTAFLGNVWTESQSKQTNLRKERMVRLEVLSNQSMKGMKVPPRFQLSSFHAFQLFRISTLYAFQLSLFPLYKYEITI